MEKLELAIPVTGLTPSKATIADKAQQIIREVQDGNIDALKTVVQIEAIAQICELVREGIKESVLTEVGKHGKETYVLDAKIQVKELGVKYDYTATPEWNFLKKQEDEIANKRKKLEEILKKLPAYATMVPNEETGEVLEMWPASKKSTTGFAITISK